MKLITWNCNQKFRESFKEIIKEDADIYIIQECENPDITKVEEYKDFASNYFWTGENIHKGLGIFARDDVKLELIDLDDNGLRYFLPVRVNDSFNLLGVWTNPDVQDKVSEYPNEITRFCELHRDNDFFKEELIICGDFNCDASLKKRHAKNVFKMKEKLEEIGLVDTYHYLNNEAQGEESQPTFYMNRNLEKPFHLDHIYAAPGRIKELEIGDEERWLKESDHLPMIFEIWGDKVDRVDNNKFEEIHYESKVFLSKSSYCKGVQCEKILWLDKYKPIPVDESNDSVFETGKIVGELAKGLFGEYIDVPYDKNLNKRIEITQELLKEGANVITEASFMFENNFCSVDILKNDADGVEIYEVKSSTKIKDIYLDDASYQYFVLSNLGLNVKKACIVYINNEYIRQKELDLKQLFNIEDITAIAQEKQDEIKNNIDFINDFMKNHTKDCEPEKLIGKFCFDPYSCAFWDYCTKDLPKPNVFDVSGMYKSKKFEKYYEGKIAFKDLENEKLNVKYLEQIDFELNNREPKIETEAIEEVLNSLKYPLYFIDYETCQYAIPEYEGTKPYQQIPFQYSLHIIEKEGAPIEHEEFLAEIGDENMIRNFALSMIGDMPEDGSVIVYNKSFEASRNKEIGKMYPDLQSEMERINGNMVDLMVPFKNRNYYTKEMQGSYSIKYVLPALYPDDPELDYVNLDLVHNGGEASQAFLTLKDKSSGEQEKIRASLLEYCKLDTYAMVKIWEKFKEVTR